MTRRAAFRQADIDRAIRAAAKVGYVVELRGDAIRLLPAHPGATVPSDNESEAEAEWDRALGLQ